MIHLVVVGDLVLYARLLTSGRHHLHVRNHLGWVHHLLSTHMLLLLLLLGVLLDLLLEHIDIGWVLNVIDQDV